MLDTAPCGYVRFSSSGKILATNLTLVQWLGKSKQDLVGNNIEILLPKSGRIFFQSQILPEILMNGELEECYLKLLANNNIRIPVLANFSREPQADEAIYNVILLRIKKRYELEDALVKAKQATDIALDELQQSNEALSRFAGMVAHDLKAPLKNMNMLTELIFKNYSSILDDDGQNLLEILKEASQRATYFVNKLLEYGSLSNDKSDFQKVDLNQVARNACDNLSSSIKESAAYLDIATLPKVDGSQVQLEQLFQNLISNAIKYRDQSRNLVIKIYATSLTSGEEKIWIVDNGIGIAPKEQEKIFEMMKRLHGNEYEGAGIGLATCKWIMQNHQGTIGVESILNQGSNFYFTFPVDIDMKNT